MKFAIRFSMSLMMAFLFAGCFQKQNSTIQQTPSAATQTDDKATPIVEKKSPENPAADFARLRKWVGKCANDQNRKNNQNIFDEPEFKTHLIEILGKDEFENLLEHFSGCFGDDFVYEKKGFLVLLGISEPHPQLVDYGMIAVNLKTRETHIFFVDEQKLTSFSNTQGDGTLPLEIKENILIYTEEAPLIGTTKQRPGDGYGCYAVLPKNWNTDWEERPYIFFITDNGGKAPDDGVMNIEGKDVLLKVKSQTEKKDKSGRTRVDWVYENKNIRAHFNMEISGMPDDSAVDYEGSLTVSTGDKSQTVQIKAFCGG